MNDKQLSEIRRLLEEVIHPETERNIVESGILENIAGDDEGISVSLAFARARDPFANSIRRQVSEALEAAFPQMRGKVSVTVRETPQRQHAAKPEPAPSGAAQIAKVIAVSSAKGGVGKSTVTANLAVSLSRMGYRVGILDADIYGPSQPKMFGVEGYMPPAESVDGRDEIVPAQVHGVSIMSIGFFINPNDALVWRGPMATSALKQMIHQTRWGELDYLLIDLPPGTGDVHLTVLHEMRVDGAVIVSTPQQVALADVVRGIMMFRSQTIAIPVLGIIENMAWFTPAELPDNRYYIFGHGGAAALAEKEGIPLLGEIPIIQSVMEGGERGMPDSVASESTAKYYLSIAEKVVDKSK